MNMSRRELEHKENGNSKRENDSEKKEDGAVKRALKSGEKLLVAGVLSAGLIMSACGSAKSQNMNDGTTEGTGGVLPGIEDTRTEDSASDLIDEDIIEEDVEPGDVPGDSIEDSIEDGSDMIGDVPEDTEMDVEDEDVATDSDEDITTDTSIDGDLDAEWDTAADTVDEDVSTDRIDADSFDAIDGDVLDGSDMDAIDDSDTIGDTMTDGGDVVGDTSEDVISDLVDDETVGDVVGDGDVVSDIGFDIGDMVGEDVEEEDVEDEEIAPIVCAPYDDTTVSTWMPTGTSALVGGVFVMYMGEDTSGNGLYDIICGGTIVRSDVPVAEGATVTTYVIEMGFRVIIDANIVESYGTNADIEISTFIPISCSAVDAEITELIRNGDTELVGGIGVKYKGLNTSGDPIVDLTCDGMPVRSDVVAPIGSDVYVNVSEHTFEIRLRAHSGNPAMVYLNAEVDAY